MDKSIAIRNLHGGLEFLDYKLQRDMDPDNQVATRKNIDKLLKKGIDDLDFDWYYFLHSEC